MYSLHCHLRASWYIAVSKALSSAFNGEVFMRTYGLGKVLVYNTCRVKFKGQFPVLGKYNLLFETSHEYEYRNGASVTTGLNEQ